MKKDIHPDYHTVKVVMTDGSEFETKMTWGKEGDVMRLDVDSKSHHAWNEGGYQIDEKAGQVEKFKNRFGGLDLGTLNKKKEA